MKLPLLFKNHEFRNQWYLRDSTLRQNTGRLQIFDPIGNALFQASAFRLNWTRSLDVNEGFKPELWKYRRSLHFCHDEGEQRQARISFLCFWMCYFTTTHNPMTLAMESDSEKKTNIKTIKKCINNFSEFSDISNNSTG